MSTASSSDLIPTSTANLSPINNRTTNPVLDELIKSKNSSSKITHLDDEAVVLPNLTEIHNDLRQRHKRKVDSQFLEDLGNEFENLTRTRGRRNQINPVIQPTEDGKIERSAIVSGSSNTDSDDNSELGTTAKISSTDRGDLKDPYAELKQADDDEPKLSPKDRAGFEALVFRGKVNTTLRYKKAWEDAKRREDADIRTHRIKKYALDISAGAVNQLTSFGVAGAAATMAGNPWLFPVVAMLTSDLVGDRLAQIIRGSTMVADGTKIHFANHRLLARSLGDLIESCSGHSPQQKFKVKVKDPETGKPRDEWMTAWGALRHAGCIAGLSAWGLNLVVRGLPFLWFSTLYGPRDYFVNAYCPNSFYPSATYEGWSNVTIPEGCPDPETMDTVALRWSIILISGMMAGALTTVSNQLLTGLFSHEERTNYSTDTYAKEVRYKESALIDCKSCLDYLGKPEADEQETIPEVIEGVETLKRILEKELRVARKKSSLWTTLQGELDLATQKHRDENVITPEFGGKRTELLMSMLGKLVSLLLFAYFSSRYVVRTSKDEQEKIMGLVFIPLSLIIIGGYALRDDARLVGHLPYGAVKGAFRACKGKPDSDDEDSVDKDTITQVPEVISKNLDHEGVPPAEKNGRKSGNGSKFNDEQVASTNSTRLRKNLTSDEIDEESVIV